MKRCRETWKGAVRLAGVCIFIAANKPTRFPQVSGYQPILLGTGNASVPAGMLSDAEGDSIAGKNPYYCEMTGLYWIWKNLELPEIVGFCHYRRYFAFHPGCDGSSWETLEQAISLEGVEGALGTADAILPRPIRVGTVEEQYATNNRREDMEIVKDILRAQHPECVPAMEAVLGGQKLYTGNMMVVRRELFHDYMEWLFPILFQAEERISIPYEDPYQRRVLGFLSERLLNIYLVYRELRLLECPLIVLPPLNKSSGDLRRRNMDSGRPVKRPR